MKKYVIMSFLIFSNLNVQSQCKNIFECNNEGKKAYKEGNYSKSYVCYRFSAVNGDLEAQLIIGEMIWENKLNDTKVNYEEAFFWFQKAANNDNAEASFYVGIFYLSGLVGKMDVEQAVFWFKKSANQNYIFAMHNLALLLFADAKYSDAFYWYEKAANLGFADSMHNLATMHSQINGNIPINKEKAFFWFKKAAENGNIQSFYKLGYCYENGFGCNKDYNSAFIWYKKAADNNVIEAMKAIGNMYDDENILGVDYITSKYWYEKGANMGDTDSMLLLGFLLDNRGGVQNNKIAFEWYQKAANLGNKVGMYKLGFDYRLGIGVNKNYELARKWYKLSCEKGFNDACISYESIKNK